MRPELRIKRADVDEIEDIAEVYKNLSNGLITKRQALAFFLFKVKGLDVETVGEIMKIECSTVYSLAAKGEEKFMRIKITAKAMNNDEWYVYS